jgi:hypothetical protein
VGCADTLIESLPDNTHSVWVLVIIFVSKSCPECRVNDGDEGSEEVWTLVSPLIEAVKMSVGSKQVRSAAVPGSNVAQNLGSERLERERARRSFSFPHQPGHGESNR